MDKTKNHVITIASLVCIAGIGIVTYAGSLFYPIYGDDLWFFAEYLGDWHSILEGWRPLTFASFKIMLTLQGSADPVGIHAVNLILHIANGFLCYYVIRNMSFPRAELAALCGSVLFMLYPFSAEAVLWASARTHLLALNLMFGSVLLFQLTRKKAKGKPYLFAGSLLLAFLAPMANEAGIVVFCLIALVLVAEDAKPREWLAILPYIVCAVICYALMPPSSEVHLGRMSSILSQGLEKNTYLLQGLAYPWASLIAWIYRLGLDLPPLPFALLCYSIILLICLLVLWRLHRLRYALLACGWYLIAYAPAFILKDANYIIHGPRLLYEASFGAVLFWVLPLTSIYTGRFWKQCGLMFSGFLIVLAIVSGIPYIQIVHELNTEITNTLDQLDNTVRGISEPILTINFPREFGTYQPAYLSGGYVVRILPARVDTDISDLLNYNNRGSYQIRNLQVSEYIPKTKWKYTLGRFPPAFSASISHDELSGELRKHERVYLAIPLDTITIREAGMLEITDSQAQKSYSAQFANLFLLLDYSITSGKSQQVITLRWQCLQPIMHQTQIFVHVYDKDGNLVVGQDQQPLLGMSDVLTWQAGDIWRDVRYINLPENLAPGDYAVVVGMYTLPDMVRLPAYTSSGQRLDGDVVYLGTIIYP